MDALYLISNAWGPKYGGINAFNTDFAKHLGLALGRRLNVGCIVLEADAKDIADAANCQVDLIPIGPSPSHDEFDPARAHDILAALQARQLPTDNACWIGHDIVTGDGANAMAGVARNATVALIHHMSYVRYQGFKHGVALTAKKKHERQRLLFSAAHRVFGVGPLLRNSLVDMLDRPREEIGMIVPGLAEIVSRPMPSAFTASAFGRLDPENDRIKQGRLAVAGFASMCSRATEPRMPKILAQRPKMWLVGIAAAGGEDEQELRAFACEQAGRAVDLDPLPYDNDRQRVLDDLARSSVALMLSWHEGFGLTGWEAIAAEVPLILGKNSGLYQLIDDRLKDAGLGCVKVIDVRGNLSTDDDSEAENFQPEDAQEVCNALLDIAHDPDRAKHNAKRLHQMLQDEGFIWEQTALRFARDLGIEPLKPDLPLAPPAESVQAAHAGQPLRADQAAPSTDPHQTQPLLQIPSRQLRGGVARAESTLLRADAECVPFHALREPVLAEVLDWVESPKTPPLAMQLRVGAGGSGKTRLMIEACRRLAERGWCAGFLRSGTDFDPHEFARLLREHPRVLVVLDYAEARQTELVALLKVALQSPPEGQLRVMLLARAVGEWWDRLPEEHSDLEDFITGPRVGIPFRLGAVNPEARQRETLFREATEAFAAALGRAERPAPPDLSADHFGQVLFIHLAALAALAGQRPETAAGLLDATLRREARYWRQSVDDVGLPDPARRGMEQAMALLTLTDGARTAAQARGLIAQVPALRGAEQAIRDGIQTLAQTFYPLDGGIDALRPDILGERLVARELARDDELLDLALREGADARTRTAALSVLTRLAQHNEGGDLWLRRGLERHLGACAEAALGVAVKVGDPCGRVLAEVLDAAPAAVRQALCDRLHPQLPEKTVALLELAEVVTRRRLVAVRPIPGRVPKNPKQNARLRARIDDYALRLRALDHLEEAQDLWQEALGIARTLVRRGDPVAHNNVATALGNLAFVLSGLGRYDEAFDHVGRALNIHRALAKARNDASVSNLATSLDNAGNRLAELGRYDEALAHAEEGLQRRRRLAEARPDAFTANLADSFTTVGNCLGDQGRFDEALAHAEEALQIHRRLADARPDAFAADLARSLGTVGNRLADQGRFDGALSHAEDALDIHRRLAEGRPDAFAADVAVSLGNQGVRFSELGSFDRALPDVEEGIQLLRRLTVSRPDRFRASLARSLGNQALVLMLCGQPGSAEQSAAEALELMPQQPGAPSAALQGQLGWALAVHAWSLLEIADPGRATSQAQNACETMDATLANRPRALPQQATLAYWIGWRCAEALGDSATGQHRANQALGVLNLWVENGALALPAYLVPAAAELLDADDRTAGAADRYLALKALLHRSAVG